MQFDQLGRLPPGLITRLKGIGLKVEAASDAFADSGFGVAQAVMIHDRATLDHPASLEAVTDFRRKPGVAKVGDLSSSSSVSQDDNDRANVGGGGGLQARGRAKHAITGTATTTTSTASARDDDEMQGRGEKSSSQPQLLSTVNSVVVILEPDADLEVFRNSVCESTDGDGGGGYGGLGKGQSTPLSLTVLSMKKKKRRTFSFISDALSMMKSGRRKTSTGVFEFSPLCVEDDDIDAPSHPPGGSYRASSSVVVEATSADGAPPAGLVAAALEWAAPGDHEIAAVIELSRAGCAIATYERLSALVRSMDLATHASTLPDHQTAIGVMGLSVDARGVLHNPTLSRLHAMIFSPPRPPSFTTSDEGASANHNVAGDAATTTKMRTMATPMTMMTAQSYRYADDRGCLAGDVLSTPFVARGHRLATCLRSGACKMESRADAGGEDDEDAREGIPTDTGGGAVAATTRVHVSAGDALTCPAATVSEGHRTNGGGGRVGDGRGTIDNFRRRSRVIAEAGAYSTSQPCATPAVRAVLVGSTTAVVISISYQ